MTEKLGKVLIVGEVMADVYIHCDIRGICPEAAVLDVKPTDNIYFTNIREVYIGGAGNIFRQLLALGCPTTIATITGVHSDMLNTEYSQLLNSVSKTGVVMKYIVNKKLTTKIRFMNEYQQIFRVSDEDSSYIDANTINKFLDVVLPVIDCYELVLLVDYNKGMMCPELVRGVINKANEVGISVVSDIKYRYTKCYDNSVVVKCNRKEYDNITHGLMPNANFVVVTNGGNPVTIFQDGWDPMYVKTYKNPYYKNANCAGDIFMAGFVNSIVNTDGGFDREIIRDAVVAGNKLASKSLSLVTDKVVRK